MKILFLLFLFINSFKLFACEFSFPENFALSLSTKNEEFFAYNGNRSLQDIPVIRLFNCKNLAMTKKFLMIAFGPQNDFFSDRQTIYDFTNHYEDRGCHIENSRFKKVLNSSERKNELQHKWDFIKSCYNISVTEESKLPLDAPRTQPGCDVKRSGLYSMSFNGGYCFVKPSILSSYLIRFSAKEECLKRDSFKDLHLTYGDLNTTLNFYAAGDATGTSLDLTALSSRPIRLTHSPDNKLIETSDDFGILMPEFPGNFVIPDIHAGTPEARLDGKSVRLAAPLWVDNNCQKKCENGFCQSVCDYSQPIASEFELYELNHSRLEYLTSWFDGGVATAHYQGEIAGIGQDISTEIFKEQKSYRLKINFSDPKFDFEKLKGNLKAKLSALQTKIPEITGGQINDIPSLPPITETPDLPVLSDISHLNFSQGNLNTLDRATRELRRYLDFKVWPPFIEKICHQETCQGVRNNYLELLVDFKVKSLKNDNYFDIEVLKIERKSHFLESYQESSPKMPKITCPTP